MLCRYRLAAACFMAVAVVLVLTARKKYTRSRESAGSIMQQPLAGIRGHKTLVPPIDVWRSQSESVGVTPPPSTKTFVPLSRESVDRVRKFVFFMGWGASGSSVIGSVLDAHPHIVIPHEYGLFEQWRKNATRFYLKKRYVFNELYKKSYDDAVSGARKGNEGLSKRGYTFSVKGMWQGQFEDHVSVIGDKKAAPPSRLYSTDPASFRQVYKELVKTVGIRVVALFLVRNPFDMAAKVATQLFAATQNMRKLDTMHKVYRIDKRLKEVISRIFDSAEASHAMIQDPKLNLTVLEVHNADYVNEPKRTVQRICDFLEVQCSEEYLQACEEKAFKSTFKTRQLVEWPSELRTPMEQQMRNFRFFDRYSFDSE